MWSSIFKAIAGAAKIAAPLVQAGATIYSAYQGRKAAEEQATATREANKRAKQQQQTLMASTQAEAEKTKQAIAKQSSALQAMLKEREQTKEKIAATQEQEKKRKRRSLIHTTPDTWYGAAPLIKKTASSPQLSATLGG